MNDKPNGPEDLGYTPHAKTRPPGRRVDVQVFAVHGGADLRVDALAGGEAVVRYVVKRDGTYFAGGGEWTARQRGACVFSTRLSALVLAVRAGQGARVVRLVETAHRAREQNKTVATALRGLAVLVAAAFPPTDSRKEVMDALTRIVATLDP